MLRQAVHHAAVVDPLHSPYAPGAGTRPGVLAGRDDVLERFEVMLSRLETGRADVAPLITGPRGSGKTVLLARRNPPADGHR